MFCVLQIKRVIVLKKHTFLMYNQYTLFHVQLTVYEMYWMYTLNGSFSITNTADKSRIITWPRRLPLYCIIWLCSFFSFDIYRMLHKGLYNFINLLRLLTELILVTFCRKNILSFLPYSYLGSMWLPLTIFQNPIWSWFLAILSSALRA